jgi:hypothetical protein
MSSTVSTDTIRDLILDGYQISIHCRAYPCTNRVKADLAEVARRRGLDREWFGQRWPYRCDRCGSRAGPITTKLEVERQVIERKLGWAEPEGQRAVTGEELKPGSVQ